MLLLVLVRRRFGPIVALKTLGEAPTVFLFLLRWYGTTGTTWVVDVVQTCTPVGRVCISNKEHS